MNKRLGATVVLSAFFVCGTALAEKKTTATVKLTSAEGAPVSFAFNPAEISVDKSVPWQKSRDSRGDAPTLEFTSSDGRSMSFELLFDTFESAENVYDKHVRPLENLTVADPNLKRPPLVTVVWGGKSPSFSGVVDGLSVKYTLFLPDGTPCRATVQVHIREASELHNKPEDPCP